MQRGKPKFAVLESIANGGEKLWARGSRMRQSPFCVRRVANRRGLRLRFRVVFFSPETWGPKRERERGSIARREPKRQRCKSLSSLSVGAILRFGLRLPRFPANFPGDRHDDTRALNFCKHVVANYSRKPPRHFAARAESPGNCENFILRNLVGNYAL